VSVCQICPRPNPKDSEFVTATPVILKVMKVVKVEEYIFVFKAHFIGY
jgi:hypothetical protein